MKIPNVMKHAKKQETQRITKQKKRIKVLLILLAITWAAAGVTVYRDYQARPGFLEKIWIADRGSDYITVAWEKPRNVYKYVITYNDKRITVSGVRSEMKLSNLEENTLYKISVRADSRKREGFEALTETATTKESQIINGAEHQMKFANTLVDLKQTAETAVTVSSDNKSMKVVGDKVMFTKPGKYVVNVTAAESEEYSSTRKKITVEVLDSVNVDPSGARQHVFYKLDKQNCELVKTVKGADKADVPQSFGYVDGQYIISYVKVGDGVHRLVEYGKSREVYKPKMNLGHSNGFTIANGSCYVVKGASNTCVSFDYPDSNYQSFELPLPASGIAYDAKSDLFFVSQYYRVYACDRNFNLVHESPRISRKGKQYSQDCGAYGGIMMHCVSGEGYHGTNYIDFYDMLHLKYLGSIECELDEVESLIVDDEGYIELLSNTTEPEDCIWKTPINMKMLVD